MMAGRQYIHPHNWADVYETTLGNLGLAGAQDISYTLFACLWEARTDVLLNEASMREDGQQMDLSRARCKENHPGDRCSYVGRSQIDVFRLKESPRPS